MKNMTLGMKITMGFGIIITIMIILSSIGVINMNKTKDSAYGLANKYAPEVDVASRIERDTIKMMYALRGYNFTGEERYLKDGRDFLDRAKAKLVDAEKLLAEYPELAGLRKGIEDTKAPLLIYEKLITDAEETIAKQNETKGVMNESVGLFIENINKYIREITAVSKKILKEGATGDAAIVRTDMATTANDILDLGDKVMIANFRAQTTGDYSGIKTVIKNFDKIDAKIDELQKVTFVDANKQLLETTRKEAHDYKKAIEDYLVVIAELDKINEGIIVNGNAALVAAETVARLGVEQTVKQSNEAHDQLSSTSTTMIIGLIIAFIIGVLAAIFIIRSITRPTIEAVRTIAEANNQVVSASDQIAANSQSLAEGASEQASSVEEVSATVEQSTATNNQNAENGREADNLARTAHEAAKIGNHKVQELSIAMNKITDSSQRIAKIIKTIDEIAFQTNLLALNAAVEAARAGEHGLGFAVVADEVKNLAQRSADAAKETAGIIEEAIEEIKNGNQIAKDTNESFAEILDKAKKTSDLIGEISASIKEQAEGMNQIATAMGQIDQVTQQNAANSEEAAAAAEELNAQALAMMQSTREIAKIVGFDIEKEVGTHGAGVIKKPKVKVTAQLPHKHLIDKKPKATLSNKESKRDDEIFPLDEDDMKKF